MHGEGEKLGMEKRPHLIGSSVESVEAGAYGFAGQSPLGGGGGSRRSVRTAATNLCEGLFFPLLFPDCKVQ